MGFLDRLFGTGDSAERRDPVPAPRPAASASRDAAGDYAPPPPADSRIDPVPGAGSVASGSEEDRQAIERYSYLLRTAPPETVEQVHEEAFARLSPAQRRQVLGDLSSMLPDAERPAGDDPRSLARAATRAEYTQPGFMERTFGGRSFAGGGPGFGSMLGASMLGTIGGYVVGSALVSSFFGPDLGGEQGYAEGGAVDGGAVDGGGGDAGAADGGAADAGGFGDVGGGDFGDFGF